MIIVKGIHDFGPSWGGIGGALHNLDSPDYVGLNLLPPSLVSPQIVELFGVLRWEV